MKQLYKQTKQMAKFIPSSKKGKDTMAYIQMLLDTGYKGNIIEATTLFRERWEENQLPEGIEINTNSFGLPEINLK